MEKERRSYDKEFKMMAVELCYAGKPTKEVAGELGIAPDLVNRWKREYKQYHEGSFPGDLNRLVEIFHHSHRYPHNMHEVLLTCCAFLPAPLFDL